MESFHNNLPKEYKFFKFPKFIDVKGRMSIINLFTSANRCGIYILYFANGEYYVGQSVDMAIRFTQHTMNHKDIVGISFILIKKGKLNEIEQRIINSFEINRVLIRNIALTSIPKGETELQKIFSQKEQNKWLRNTSAQPKVYRTKKWEEHRRKYEKKFIKLCAGSYYDEVIKFLKVYFRYLVPEPYLTAMDFWRISCLPYRSKDVEILCRVNIYIQEVLTIYVVDENLYYSMHIARSEFPLSKFKKTGYNLKGILISNHMYKTGGADQINVDIYGTSNAIRFINNNRKSVKLFNLRLMNKGVGFNRLSHCIDLANKVLPLTNDK